MAKQASYYVKKALQKLLVQASEQEIEASEAQDTIDAMNDFFLELDSAGVPLGYTEISNLGEYVTIPDYARRMAIYNLAVNLGPEYDAPVPMELALIAEESMRAVELIVIQPPIAVYPDTLPVGAGNDCGGNYSETFYPGDTDGEILTEANPGSILQEEGTATDE